MNLLQEASTNSTTLASSSSAGIFSGMEKSLVDHPMRLDLEKGALNEYLFGEEGSGGGDSEVCFEKVYCGASETAIALRWKVFCDGIK